MIHGQSWWNHSLQHYYYHEPSLTSLVSKDGWTRNRKWFHGHQMISSDFLIDFCGFLLISKQGVWDFFHCGPLDYALLCQFSQVSTIKQTRDNAHMWHSTVSNGRHTDHRTNPESPLLPNASMHKGGGGGVITGFYGIIMCRDFIAHMSCLCIRWIWCSVQGLH